MNELIKINKNINITSLQISKCTGKKHFHILRDIEDEMNQLEEKGKSIFGLTFIKNKSGRLDKVYDMDKYGLIQMMARYDAKIRYMLIKKLRYIETKGTKRIKRTPKLLLLEDNGVQSFITDCLTQSSSDIKSVVLYRYYIIYCDKNKYHTLGRNYFLNAMRESNLTYYTENCKANKYDKKFRGFKNIKLKDNLLLEGDN
jgi:hypothetical protein